MKKDLVYISVGVVVVALGGFAVIYFLGNTNPGNYKQNADGTKTYTSTDGTVTVGAGAGMPSLWPVDAPDNYVGATIIFSGNANPETGKNGAAVSYTLKDVSADDVVLFYKRALTTNGWTVVGNMDLGTHTVIGGKKDTRTFAVNIVDNKDGSLTVTAGVEL